MTTEVEMDSPETAGLGRHGHRPSKRRFLWHYVEMVIAMAVGMVVLGAAVRGIVALTGLEYSTGSHPELSTLEMAFDMSVGMVAWMRFRRHGWAASLEMAAAMFAPAIAMIALYRLDAVDADTMIMLEHVVMFPLMLVIMLRRRREYGA
ncbi:hypothetical protein GCM10029992_34870 [Glycomyces albus]